jgi:phage terminase large subunit-like protein
MMGGNRSRDTIRQEVEADFLSGGGKILKPDAFPIVDSLPQGDMFTFITVDLAGFKKAEGSKILRTDESVVAVTHTWAEDWFVRDIRHGHWDVRRTALEIVNAVRQFPGARLGIEQGALKEAVGPYLEEYMREFSRYITPEPLRHNNTRKQDRIAWALQGRSERGLIKLLRGPWNDHFLTQAADFPDPLAHDDVLDAVSYVDQMARAYYVDPEDITEWEPTDLDAGY